MTVANPTPDMQTEQDPLKAVLDLDRALSGWFVGFLGALALHGAGAARGLTAMYELQRFAEQVQALVALKMPSEVDIQVDEEPPPPEPEPEPEPEEEPEPEPEPEPPPPDPEPIEQPAAAAQAAEVLTAEPDPNEPLDLTGEGFVTGTSEKYVGGTTSAQGTAKNAVYNPVVSPTGVPGGTGTKPAAPKKSLARRAMPNGTSWSDCGFPAEADIEQINFANVTVVVTVSPTGAAKAVSVLKDPGYGFGQLAKRCAMRKTYSAALDAAGQPITSTTPPFRIKFTR